MSAQKVVLVACGSFNPITNMHLRMFELARDHLHKTGRFTVVSGVISPVSDAYGKKDLSTATHRCAMILRALQTSSWIRLDTWESEQPQWTPTAQFLRHFNKRIENTPLISDRPKKRQRLSPKSKESPTSSQPKDSHPPCVKLLCGADLLESFAVPNLWADNDLEYILSQHGLVCISRPEYNPLKFIYESDLLSKHQNNIEIVTNWMHNDISATKIRRALRRNESVKYLIQDSVYEYISDNHLYGYIDNKLLNDIIPSPNGELTTDTSNESTPMSSPARLTRLARLEPTSNVEPGDTENLKDSPKYSTKNDSFTYSSHVTEREDTENLKNSPKYSTKNDSFNYSSHVTSELEDTENLKNSPKYCTKNDTFNYNPHGSIPAIEPPDIENHKDSSKCTTKNYRFNYTSQDSHLEFEPDDTKDVKNSSKYSTTNDNFNYSSHSVHVSIENENVENLKDSPKYTTSNYGFNYDNFDNGQIKDDMKDFMEIYDDEVRRYGYNILDRDSGICEIVNDLPKRDDIITKDEDSVPKYDDNLPKYENYSPKVPNYSPNFENDVFGNRDSGICDNLTDSTDYDNVNSVDYIVASDVSDIENVSQKFISNNDDGETSEIVKNSHLTKKLNAMYIDNKNHSKIYQPPIEQTDIDGYYSDNDIKNDVLLEPNLIEDLSKTVPVVYKTNIDDQNQTENTQDECAIDTLSSNESNLKYISSVSSDHKTFKSIGSQSSLTNICDLCGLSCTSNLISPKRYFITKISTSTQCYDTDNLTKYSAKKMKNVATQTSAGNIPDFSCEISFKNSSKGYFTKQKSVSSINFGEFSKISPTKFSPKKIHDSPTKLSPKKGDFSPKKSDFSPKKSDFSPSKMFNKKCNVSPVKSPKKNKSIAIQCGMSPTVFIKSNLKSQKGTILCPCGTNDINGLLKQMKNARIAWTTETCV